MDVGTAVIAVGTAAIQREPPSWARDRVQRATLNVASEAARTQAEIAGAHRHYDLVLDRERRQRERRERT
jgi:hypothetical protein